MIMDACCGNSRHPKSVGRSVRQILAWGLPNILLVLLPKCPACLAAYVALWTGIGLSLSTVMYLRWSVLLLCVGSLILLIMQRRKFIVGLFKTFKLETKSCNTLL
jgi:hypothetical protein